MRPEHWAQGPLDVEPLNSTRTRWQFRWWLEPGPGLAALGEDRVADAINHILNGLPFGWGKTTGVDFSQVGSIQVAHITVRFSDQVPPGAHTWAGGWYYTDTDLRAVAQITPNEAVFNNPHLLAHLVGMEIVGHGCFRMNDMYPPEHAGYAGAMGLWHPAEPGRAYPNREEIESALAWLRGAAVDIRPNMVVEGL